MFSIGWSVKPPDGVGVRDGLDDVLGAGVDEVELDVLALVLPVDLQVVLQDQVHPVLGVKNLGLFNLAAGCQQLKALVGVDPAGAARRKRGKCQQQHGHHDDNPDAGALEETLSFHLFGAGPRPSW